MKSLFAIRTALALLLSTLQISLASAENASSARWLRQNAISPDGSCIAFAYQGDIFLVPSQGGLARQLTSNPAHDTEPLWSADGKWIVFASVREGSKDLWAISAEGGAPRRLTCYGGSETPLAMTPDGNVLFSANIEDVPGSSVFPGDNKLYSISLQEALSADKDKLPVPARLSSFEICNASVNASGIMLYEDWKGYEDPFRKHHTSAVTRDIWKIEGGAYTKLTDYVGEDRNPVFAPDGKNFYYLSEQNTGKEEVDSWGGDSNIWRSDLSGAAPQRITDFKGAPVRYLSIASDGTLCFSWNGDLYTLKEGEQPKKLEISVSKDVNEREHILRSAISGADDIAVSPDGKEIAIVCRGDVYVTTLDLKDTRRITDTPCQERSVSFGEDGRSLYYASERDGEWGIYRTVLSDKKDKYFTFSYKTKEERVSPEGQTCFQPSVSPDGKWVAYLRDRTELVIRSTSGGKEKVLLKGDVNYSYSDGDTPFAWSPDSRYLLSIYQGGGRMYNEDIALISVEDGSITDLTQSGYSDMAFRWALEGKAMTWESDKAGYRSHGSWGAEGDIFIMFFDDEAYAKFCRDKDVEAIEKLLAGDKKSAKKDTASKEKKDAKLELELSRRADRIIKLTPHSGRIGDHWLSPDGKKLFYVQLLEKTRDLCCLDIAKKSVNVLCRNLSGSFVPAPDGKGIFVVSGSGIEKVSLDGSRKKVEFHGEYEYFPDKEREYIFQHCWKQVAEKFYDPAMHGVDWAAQKANYEQFLPYIKDNYAFRELLSEMLGELNGSHTGGRFYDGKRVATGHMGVIFDTEFKGPGLKIKEFLPESVLQQSSSEVHEGDVITAINGKPIPEGQPWYQALSEKAGKRILLTIKGKKEIDVYVKTTSDDSEGWYKRWVRRNEEKVRELSGGRIGYVHVKGMNSPSFREVYSKALGEYRECDALIVDTRHNGGGWLHNDLANFLNGKLYTNRNPRGVYMAPEPYDKWIKPSCVLVCEDNYSDACGFPYVYRALGIGPIIGSPVAGTATSVWWERQVNPMIVFGIPQIGSFSISEGRYLENHQLQPDILVYNDPAAVERGEDPQLQRAVEEMMKKNGGR